MAKMKDTLESVQEKVRV
jgi:hypothetical protein